MIHKKLLNLFFFLLIGSQLIWLTKAAEEEEEEEEKEMQIKTCSDSIEIGDEIEYCKMEIDHIVTADNILDKIDRYCTKNSKIYALRNDDSVNCIVNIRVYDNSSNTQATRIVLIGIALSWYIYGKYATLSFIGLRRHKNYNFLFPFTAAIFAFVNNFNDLIFYIYHPADKSVCENVFLPIFIGSATLNWAPISWLQAYRLAVISKINLPKKGFLIITTITVTLSCIYCTFYYCNLSLFSGEQNRLIGCVVSNPGTYSYYVMVSDIVDSAFAFTAICTLIYRSIRGLRELNTRNQKLNDLASQGILQLLVITLAKIIIYPLIALTSEIPALDVFWDVLSVIVIICGYKLVNFPYEHVDGKDGKGGIKRNIFTFIETTMNYSFSTSKVSGDGRSSGSLNNTTKSYVKNESSVQVPKDEDQV